MKQQRVAMSPSQEVVQTKGRKHETCLGLGKGWCECGAGLERHRARARQKEGWSSSSRTEEEGRARHRCLPRQTAKLQRVFC